MKWLSKKIKCHLIKCPSCSFIQQTFQTQKVECCNENCKQIINVQESLIQIVNGTCGGLKTYETDGNSTNLSIP
jgi:hypothetical protein